MQPAIEVRGQLQRVQRLQLGSEVDDRTGLVALYVADDRPRQVGQVGQLGRLVAQLLQPVLAEPAAAGRVRLTYGLGGTRLRDREQPHLTGVPARVRAGSRDLCLYLLDPPPDLGHGQRAPSETAARAAMIPKMVAMPAYCSVISASTFSYPI